MIEAAGDQSIAGSDRGCCFEAVAGLVFPNQAAVCRVETVEIAIGGAEIDVFFIDGWLSRPARAAPRIFV
jgi:hypothetical protein